MSEGKKSDLDFRTVMTNVCKSLKGHKNLKVRMMELKKDWLLELERDQFEKYKPESIFSSYKRIKKWHDGFDPTGFDSFDLMKEFILGSKTKTFKTIPSKMPDLVRAIKDLDGKKLEKEILKYFLKILK